jgi:hypothetical protein
MGPVPPTRIIDLRDKPIACAVCSESLAIYEFNGDPSTLVCSECSGVGADIAVAMSGCAAASYQRSSRSNSDSASRGVISMSATSFPFAVVGEGFDGRRQASYFAPAVFVA